ncbi:hypothetical protein MMC18_000271 [Xylographa bjoerkii]|nr:hypothetical protein [Xylographa bjoerkii]
MSIVASNLALQPIMFSRTQGRWPPSSTLLPHLRVRCARKPLPQRISIPKAHIHLQVEANPKPFRCTTPDTTPSSRDFSTTRPHLKKGQRDEPKRTVEKAAVRSEAADNDPYDFSDLEAGIDRALDRLNDDLAKLKPGGRFNPDVLEALRVSLVKGSRETVKLADLAQVVPRGGRTVVVLVGEADHVKPITSAILSSPYSLNPVPAPHSPLELHIPVPPATHESRQQTLAVASKAGETAGHAVRQARGAQQKLLRAMELAKKVRPDDLKKAKDRMEKVVEKGNEEVKKRVEGARRALERG